VTTLRSAPTAADGIHLPRADEHVCIIVPAHNEAANIARR
jgi:hypothetical protein